MRDKRIYTETFKGLPIYWKSENGNGVIVYDQFAFMKKFKLYINNGDYWSYSNSSDFLSELITYAKKNYYIMKKRG